MNLTAISTLLIENKMFANPRRIALLNAIERTGSISQGAKEAGISYKTAFDAVKEMNLLAGEPLVSSEKGGKGGGGAALTRFGKRLVQMYQLLHQIQDMGLKALNDDSAPLESLLAVMSRFSLQTSARNQFFGHISHIERHDLHDVVQIAITPHHRISATITHGSTVKLQLEADKDVVALIKGPAITVCSEDNLIHGKRDRFDNQLVGTITALVQDMKSTEVTIALTDDIAICALVDNRDLMEENLRVGMEIYALFHSNQVTIATMC
ncbi:LysR family transcriptional regulator [Photobacterium sp. CAIM 1937]|nr:LysR family transcriptional regulator [Vibrio parahaemolyticus]MZG57008.1 LysR family transcriptional regulator [Photobacterium lucens]MZG81822.1 LysR family transcriptional regulator [Photobacterium lucens]